MSHFRCPECETDCLEDENGHYVTGCEHFPPDIISDGFGSEWPNHCPHCDDFGTMQVCRPGQAQCQECGGKK